MNNFFILINSVFDKLKESFSLDLRFIYKSAIIFKIKNQKKKKKKKRFGDVENPLFACDDWRFVW